MNPASSFSIKLGAQITGIALVAALTAFLCLNHAWLFVFIAIVLLWLLASSVFRIIRDSVKASDMLVSAIEKNDGTFSPSREHLHPLIAANIIRIKRLLTEKQEKITGQEQFFKEIIELVNTGIICMLPDGKVKIHNTRTLSLLNRPVFTHLKQLEDTNLPLFNILTKISGGETRQLATPTESLLIHAASTEICGEKLKIITLDDIDSALADYDIESWSRYSAVIIHELKNSLTPIASISKQILNNDAVSVAEIREKIEPVYSCATYLKNFVDGMNAINRMPDPSFSLFNLHSFLNRSAILASHINSFPIGNITVRCDESLLANSDESLLGQVVTNLLKNSIEAVKEIPDPKIVVSGYCGDDENIIIDITNNGPAISPDIALKVFVPFFTTKENGSGIGLSLSRQLVRRCDGTLKLADISPHPTFRITIP